MRLLITNRNRFERIKTDEAKKYNLLLYPLIIQKKLHQEFKFMKKVPLLILLIVIQLASEISKANSGHFVLEKSFFENALYAPGDSVVVLSNENYFLPLNQNDTSRIGVLYINKPLPGFTSLLGKYKSAKTINASAINSYEEGGDLAQRARFDFDKLIIVIVNNAGEKPDISPFKISLIKQLQNEMRTLTVIFGNPAVANLFAYAPSLIISTNSSTQNQKVAAELIFGKSAPKGKFSKATGNAFPSGAGLRTLKHNKAFLPTANPETLGIDTSLFFKVDSIAKSGIDSGAFPGCTLVAMKDGKIFYQKAYGYLTYDKNVPVTNGIIYDMASVTKIGATTLAVMKLYDEGKLKLDGTLGEYLPWLQRSDKANITIKDIMLHQAGFEPDFPYLNLMLTDSVHPNPNIFHTVRDSIYTMRVAERMYMNKYYKDILNMEIRSDTLMEHPKYVYSDIDLQLMGYIVEKLSGMPLEQYVKKNFYDPMGMTSTGFLPRQRYALNQIAPTEDEKIFRLQQLHGDVHDPRAAMWGGVQGHAGLFSSAYDMAVYLHMLLNEGSFNGKQYLKPSTVALFTSYQSEISRRGIGFDKPLRDEDRAKVDYDYPAKYASPKTFGHTGYTGTCVWADPQYNFVYVLLTNRVYPNGGVNTKIYNMGIQRKIMDTFYEAMGAGKN